MFCVTFTEADCDDQQGQARSIILFLYGLQSTVTPEDIVVTPKMT